MLYEVITWEFVVNSVFDDVPENSHIKFDLILQRKALLYYMRNFDYTIGQLDNSNIRITSYNVCYTKLLRY